MRLSVASTRISLDHIRSAGSLHPDKPKPLTESCIQCLLVLSEKETNHVGPM